MTDMQQMTMIQAINSAMDVMMERDPTVVVMGEDVGFFGGVFRATAGLQDKYGKNRVFDTPITECGIIGVAWFLFRSACPDPSCEADTRKAPHAGPYLGNAQDTPQNP